MCVVFSLIEDIIVNTHGSLFLIGGDVNVDFNRVSCHTALLDSFCTYFDLLPVTRHANSVLDYTYNFSMSRFSILDHFLLSSDLFCASVECAFVSHSVLLRSRPYCHPAQTGSYAHRGLSSPATASPFLGWGVRTIELSH